MLLGVDVGGTFTDAVLLDGARVVSAKAPTTPADEATGVLAAIDAVLARARRPASAVEGFAHGMTVATNALLEQRVARTALLATEGFTDLVELARQARPQLYRLCAAPPAPLVPPERRFAAPERTGPGGVLRALEEPAARAQIEQLAAAEPEAVAVVLLHAYAHPEHERRLRELLAERLPDVHISLSHEVVGTFREYERAATTEVDAALSPLVGRYLRALIARTAAAELPAPQVMQSSGGLASAERAAAHAALTVLSGPAGGAQAAELLARLCDEPDVLCMDMGGTSCDVCLLSAGRARETTERTLAGRPLALPMLDIHTVGAGGGSIAWRDAGGALRVGPRSAGADPGPASYGRGGREPTVTDANVVLGRLPANASGVALDRQAAERAVGALAAELGLADPVACAEGIVRIAGETMVGALRVMTVERGIDPRSFALLAFGGAGPLHACALAEELGIERVLCPRAGGVLSALGMVAAAPRRDVTRSVLLALEDERRPAIAAAIEQARAQAAAELGGARPARTRTRVELRYRGQSFELAVDADPLEELRERFEAAHEQRYGYRDPDGEVELVTVRATAWGAQPVVELAGGPARVVGRSAQRVHVAGAWREGELREGEPAPGTHLQGPAVWALPGCTLLVPPGWEGGVDVHGTVVLVRTPP